MYNYTEPIVPTRTSSNNNTKRQSASANQKSSPRESKSGGGMVTPSVPEAKAPVRGTQQKGADESLTGLKSPPAEHPTSTGGGGFTVLSVQKVSGQSNQLAATNDINSVPRSPSTNKTASTSPVDGVASKRLSTASEKKPVSVESPKPPTNPVSQDETREKTRMPAVPARQRAADEGKNSPQALFEKADGAALPPALTTRSPPSTSAGKDDNKQSSHASVHKDASAVPIPQQKAASSPTEKSDNKRSPHVPERKDASSVPTSPAVMSDSKQTLHAVERKDAIAVHAPPAETPQSTSVMENKHHQEAAVQERTVDAVLIPPAIESSMGAIESRHRSDGSGNRDPIPTPPATVSKMPAEVQSASSSAIAPLPSEPQVPERTKSRNDNLVEKLATPPVQPKEKPSAASASGIQPEAPPERQSSAAKGQKKSSFDDLYALFCQKITED